MELDHILNRSGHCTLKHQRMIANPVEPATDSYFE